MKPISILLLFFCLLVFCFSPAYSQLSSTALKADPPFLSYNPQWVDSVFKQLTPDERIAQLIMVAAYSNRSKGHVDTISALIKQYKIGGLVFFQGGPVRQARLTNLYQAQSKVPLLIAMDAEWGVAMRLDSTMRFPYQMALGAIQGQDSLIYQMGVEVAHQFKRLGMHVNFAPVVDVNNNPNNPVINFRSFGENKYRVTEKSYAYMKGMQDNGIMAVAKHFPGHGDTDADSHYALPVITKDRPHLDSLELYPFREMIRLGMGGMMVAHLSIPSLDATQNLPSTLSKPIITDLLKKDLGFRGLVFTDAMNMKGVTKFFPAGLADAKAILAGNDVLEFTEDVEKAIAQIKEAIKRGDISQADIDSRCKRVLAAKLWAGLDQSRLVELKNIVEDLNSPRAMVVNRKLVEASLTLVKNEQKSEGASIIPLQRLDTLRIASLSLGSAQLTPFQQMLGNYTAVDHYNLTDKSTEADITQVKARLKAYNLVLMGIHGLSIRPARNYGITPALAALVKNMSNTVQTNGGKVVISLFSNAYTLAKFEGLEQSNGVLLSYQENPVTQELAAQALFGGIGVQGKLPVTVNAQFGLDNGIPTTGLSRFRYGIPEEVNIDSRLLTRKIDSLAQQAIAAKATPGCQVVVAKDGKVVFQKSYGYQTYENKIAVTNQQVYDLASITKVSASLPALMRLADEGKFDVNKTLKDYLPGMFGKSNKADIPFKQILTHQARLKAWIPFWKEALKKDGVTFKKSIFRTDSSKRFSIRVANKLFLNRKYYKKIYREIVESPLNDKPGYVYSDLSFYLYPLIVKKITGKDFETYLKETFYRPLGAYSLTYNAYLHNPLAQVVPTEYDSLFRKNLIHGRVHDEGAALLNGLSGHAGLFGNANDLAKLMEMYLQKGYFGGQRFLGEATLAEFARCQFCPENRRALGFDRPVTPSAGNAAKSASTQSFGHSGFTGTFTWVDPVYNLVYVFLSNRVYPTRNNAKLSELNTRTNIQQAIYDSMINRGGMK
ncbi:MAG: glycoside hydrolase family 3 N-terminal domain-containing protein [Bacteroidota bacterium]